MPRTLRLPPKGWPRLFALRRLTALALLLAAAAVALEARTTPTGVPMLVAAHDLPSGVTLRLTDVRVVQTPAQLRPTRALTTPAEADGRVLAGTTAAGEPLTATRLISPANAQLTTGDPTAAAVPFRLADPAVAGLLTSGTRVDVVTISGTEPVVLAHNAKVLTVRPASEAEGRLVVLALPGHEATRVAGASLGQPVAVTLR